MSVRKLNCQKICDVLRLHTRVRIFQKPVKAYKNRLTIFKFQEITSEPSRTMLFHINRFRESNLVELDGPRRCFKVATGFLARLYDSEIQSEEIE
jgi:hypothetical protein